MIQASSKNIFRVQAKHFEVIVGRESTEQIRFHMRDHRDRWFGCSPFVERTNNASFTRGHHLMAFIFPCISRLFK